MENEAYQRKKSLEYRNQLLDGLVDGLTVYDNGVAVLKRRSCSSNILKPDKSRGAIVELSAKARAKMLFVISCTSVDFGSMITLTYPQEFPRCGKRVKQHLNDFLRSYLHRYGGHYFWFLEFQDRGAPHIHLLVSRSNIFSRDREWFALRWADVLDVHLPRRYCSLFDRREKDMRMQVLRVNTHPQAWEKIRDRDGARKYVAKYALKTYQKEVPEQYQNVGRFYGYSRAVKNTIRPLDNFSIKAETIRKVLELEGHKVAEWDVLPKYLFGVTSFQDLTSAL